MELENSSVLNLSGGISGWSLTSTNSDQSENSLLRCGSTDRSRESRTSNGGSYGGSSSCCVRWYARFLTKFPYVIPVLVVLLASTCGVLSYKYHPLPDFGQDPVKGIETRGTPIRKAWSTTMSMFHNLHRENGIYSMPNLTMALLELGMQGADKMAWMMHKAGKRKRRDVELVDHHAAAAADGDDDAEATGSMTARLSPEGQQCANRNLDPSDDVKFAYEGPRDLFTYHALSDMCSLEVKHLQPILQEACPLMSLPYYVALLNGKESCALITESDVASVASLLDKCAPFYKDGSLHSSATKSGVPHECLSGGYIYKIFHFLTDENFYQAGKRGPLRYSVAYWKKQRFSYMDSTKFYQIHLENKQLGYGTVRLSAVGLVDQLDVKYTLFAKYVLEDLLYFAIAGGVILFLMFIYLQSFVLILATVVNIVFSFAIAYFIYFFVFGLKFYPFINLLAGLILVAVGADDVFIFYDCWLQFRKDKHLEMDEVVGKTLDHAALAIFVTSLTTASAFFSNMISCITSIQCFAIFAGVAVLVNFVLMVTWTPSIIILCELCSKKMQKLCCPRVAKPVFLQVMNEKLEKLSVFIFGRVFPLIVEKGWLVWLILLSALGIGSCIIVFVTPRLKLPSTADFQVFPSSNLLEHWDLVVAAKIGGLKEQAMRTSEEVPLDFLWGVEARDEGDKLNPDDEPNTVTLDRDFDFYSKESQVWFDDFCHGLLGAPYSDPRYTKHNLCIFDAYTVLLKTYCSRSSSSAIHSTCCNDLSVPFNSSSLRVCFPLMSYYYAAHMHDIGFNPLGNQKLLGVPIFDDNNVVVGINFHTKANYTMSFSYSIMKERYTEIDSSLKTQLKRAPKSLQGGFFSAETKFGFYDLQDAIATGTYYSIGLSLGVAFIVMLLTSRNVLICLYAILTITLAIASTVAAIVLLGWSLNIIESITVSLAVGLSIDFTIHYGVAYRLSSEYGAKSRVNEAFERVGGAVAMAALTTFVAGASVMPSRVLPYVKLGIFLMFCMAISWTYATFFFQSLCRIAGPRGNFCQMRLCCKKKAHKGIYIINQSGRNSVSSLQSYDAGLIVV